MFFNGDLLTLPPLAKPAGVGILLSAILEDSLRRRINTKRCGKGCKIRRHQIRYFTTPNRVNLLQVSPQRLLKPQSVASPQRVATSHSLTLMTAVSCDGKHRKRDQTGRHLTQYDAPRFDILLHSNTIFHLGKSHQDVSQCKWIHCKVAVC